MARHALTPHEFILVEMTMIQSAYALAARQSGTSPQKLADAHINLANVTFMEQHKSEIEALQEKSMDTPRQEARPAPSPAPPPH
jgi:hypothetical protein